MIFQLSNNLKKFQPVRLAKRTLIRASHAPHIRGWYSEELIAKGGIRSIGYWMWYIAHSGETSRTSLPKHWIYPLLKPLLNCLLNAWLVRTSWYCAWKWKFDCGCFYLSNKCQLHRWKNLRKPKGGIVYICYSISILTYLLYLPYKAYLWK